MTDSREERVKPVNNGTKFPFSCHASMLKKQVPFFIEEDKLRNNVFKDSTNL